MIASIVCFLFFFQAEDGIRDVAVTGVQTCALPICRKCLSASGRFAITRKKPLACFVFASRLATSSFSAGSTRRIAVAISSSIEARQKLPVAFQKIQFAQSARRLPAKIVKNEIARLALI